MIDEQKIEEMETELDERIVLTIARSIKKEFYKQQCFKLFGELKDCNEGKGFVR